MATRKLTIDRRKWLRGGTSKTAMTPVLWNREVMRGCCLGLYLHACGLPVNVLRDRSMPHEISDRKDFPEEARWLMSTSSEMDSVIADQLSTANDGSRRTEQSREKEVKRLFAKNGVVVNFVGRDVPKKLLDDEDL